MKKILLFTDCLGAGGAQRQLVGLAKLLKENGYTIKVCTYYNIDFYKKQLDDAGVANELIPGADNTKRRILAVRHYFKQERPDCVVAYQETPSLVACVAKLLGCKFNLIVSERNTTQSIGLNERVRFFLYHWADFIVPNSFTQGNYLESNYKWMRKKLRVITNFVDSTQFPPIQHMRNNKIEIVVAATIWKPKNTLGLIEAIHLLNDKIPLSDMLHISWYGKQNGNNGYFEQCISRINEYSLSSIISLKEKTKKIVDVYHSADYLCLPSLYEGTPNVICEAISTGLPVICSDVCDNHIYIKEATTGFLFDPRNPQSIADAIFKAIQISDEDYQYFRSNCTKIAGELLTKEKFLNSYLSLFD